MKVILIAGKDLEEFERCLQLLKDNIWGVCAGIDQGWEWDRLFRQGIAYDPKMWWKRMLETVGELESAAEGYSILADLVIPVKEARESTK